ncbi:hypothetical protein BBJ28_00011832 [Nothophytophthora sp. Chile5]|nr:hypothetical protein BBJ28_00011832 [Nothophytophthora sp. Chile5]
MFSLVHSSICHLARKISRNSRTNKPMTCPDSEAQVTTERDPASPLDGDTSVAVLIDTIATSSANEQQHALLLLVRKCADNQEREKMYQVNGIHVLSEVVTNGDTFISQVYALKCLSWAPTDDDSKLAQSDFDALQDSVRDATSQELSLLMGELRHPSEERKEDAAVLCASIAIRGQKDSLREVGVVSPLVEILRGGTAVQKLWAANALGRLASNEENCVVIASEGAISPLIALVGTGTDLQKRHAASALGALSNDNTENCVAIAREGGISPLVALVRTGDDKQKEGAATVLGHISYQNAENRVAITREGGIAPLVALLRAGTDGQKQRATYALGLLALQNDDNRTAIARAGAIPSLVALLRAGTSQQKEEAAYAVGNLAGKDRIMGFTFEGAVPPLVALLREGDDTQKHWAVYALRHLAAYTEESCVAIVQADGIPPLVALLRIGTAKHKRHVTTALGLLAFNSEQNRVAIAREGAIPLLVTLERTETDKLKDNATFALTHLAKNEANGAAIAKQRARKRNPTGIRHSRFQM